MYLREISGDACREAGIEVLSQKPHSASGQAVKTACTPELPTEVKMKVAFWSWLMVRTEPM